MIDRLKECIALLSTDGVKEILKTLFEVSRWTLKNL